MMKFQTNVKGTQWIGKQPVFAARESFENTFRLQTGPIVHKTIRMRDFAIVDKSNVGYIATLGITFSEQAVVSDAYDHQFKLEINNYGGY